MSLPGTGKNDQFGDTTINPKDATKAARVITWHARTDTEHAMFTNQLGLDEGNAA
jgi:hypothetical protein